ncbi:hypothetical protein V8E53_003047, partial [Lactarius tabidus]
TSISHSAVSPGPLLAVSASNGINILRNTPSILSAPQENVRAIRAVLNRVEAIAMIRYSSLAASPIIYTHLRTATPSLSGTLKAPNSTTPAPPEPPSFEIACEERVLQDIVDEEFAQDVWVTRARRQRVQELVEARPSAHLAVTAALSRKECECVAGVI